MKDKVFLPGLNGIRAIAALTVLIFHIDQNLPRFGLKFLGFHTTGMAGYGVILFFVLSGYLITYLLLTEKRQYQKIDLLKFYTRRILRIWPIYYLLILITLILILINKPFLSFVPGRLVETFTLYSLLLSNIGFGLGLGISSITPLWSIGVEEQFYAAWPFLLNKSKNILISLLVIIVLYILIKIGFRFFENGSIYSILINSSFNCMAIGGIGAYLVFTNNKILNIIYNPLSQVFSWSVLVFSLIYKPLHLFSIIDGEMNAIFYIVIILNVSTNKHTIINLETRIFDFLGKISYGIYVWHMIVILFLSQLIKKLLLPINSIMYYSIVFATVIMFVIVIAWLSYIYFESFFLKLKVKYTKVESVASSRL